MGGYYRLHFIALTLGFLLDLLLGDPLWLPHPIRGFGRLIEGLEKTLRRQAGQEKGKLLRNGCLLTILVLLLVTGAAFFVLFIAYGLSPWAGLAAETFMCYQMLAARGLKTESMKVYAALSADDVEGARQAVSMIVGRDTQKLDAAGITRAAVETVAENTADGSIAPMLYMAFGGAALGFFYKAVNTMDSMIGYKNEKYLYFGRAAARLDDVCNYLPSRLAALLMLAAGFFTGMDYKGGWRVWRRDNRNHASPNSAQTESAAAGCLNIRLAGDAWYFGRLYEKPYIGDDIRPVEITDIVRANRLLYGASWLLMLLIILIDLVLYIF